MVADRLNRLIFTATSVVIGSSGLAWGSDVLQFNRDIRPILADRCFNCHGADAASRKADLRLDVPESAFAERDGIRAIVPGDPAGSELVRRILSGDPDERMPPPDHPIQLDAAQKELLERWIGQGAKYEGHWAFLPPERPESGASADPWMRNPIDGFILPEMRAAGLDPNLEASRETLLRRLSLDLTGLPPTPAELDEFLGDRSPEAYERQVDRLLASPRYGERMAMWWLDGARYADSHGFQADWERYQWPWRDWVIEAFNRNQPFDEFTVEQIAGDMLPNATPAQIVATGFNRNHRINTEGGSLDEEWLVENVMDRLETIGSVWLGLTVGCARCHDHKYDPLSQREFYQLFAFFNNVPEQGKGPGKQGNFEPVIKIASAPNEAEIARLESEIGETEKQLLKWLPKERHRIADTEFAKRGGNADGQLKKAIQALKQADAQELKKRDLDLRKKHEELERKLPSVMVMKEMETPRPTFILERGEYDQRGEKVEAALPAALPPMPEGEAMNRLGFAHWLVSPGHPLTARVQVNRFWEQIFGTGLVKSSENLGTQADWPSHPELLDWLATEFVRLDWDVKALLKTLVMSATYRQSSEVDLVSLEVDPENRLLSRGPRFRVQAETIRDQALFMAGLLHEQLGGPSVRPYQPEGIWSEFNFYGNLRDYKNDKGPGLYRRSLYTIWKRTAAPPGMTLFDMPSREICIVKRSRTNTPLQALALLNEVTYVEASRVLAERMIREGGNDPSGWLRHGFRIVTARHPSPEELETLERGYQRRREFFANDPSKAKALLAEGESAVDDAFDPVDLAALATTAGILLNLDETITKE